MKITYIAKRFREGVYICHDVVVDGVYINLFGTGGESVEKIALRTDEWLNAPFPEHRRNDSISVMMGSLNPVGG